MLYFSVIIPVYNRPDEVRDLLESLSHQTDNGFEVVLVEDGSTRRCDEVANAYADRLKVSYFYKEKAEALPATTEWNGRQGTISYSSTPTA